MCSRTHALNARVQWALYTVALVAGDQLAAECRRVEANWHAQNSGDASARANDNSLPCLLSDVPALAEVWQHAYAEKMEQICRLRTPDGIRQWIAEIADAANKGCGLVYELFASNFSAAVDRNIGTIEPEYREQAMQIAREHGYMTPEESDAMWAEMRSDGYCSHGLDAQTCPCGCFEHDDGYYDEPMQDLAELGYGDE
ncbi:hypothetical protein [Paraburkholderia phytofirmans]|uniref:Uncharacterized protein n=1 Tax=Paraburkholderia phytofirmans (strain DSM 17436 / LMG 22146 / PsJN) TaxID=398527 RepID=B2TH58_PARPJ|nr:hypothetical protein [Paraburkholderia phytofirmans]ACD21607.1 conserved hypothetical protein [Paraburkholderia phytofirmans PsJN]